MEIKCNNAKLFEYEEENFLQLLGDNKDRIKDIVKIYSDYFSNAKYTDLEIMSWQHGLPEVVIDGTKISRTRKEVLVLSSAEDIYRQMSLVKDSLLSEYLDNFAGNMELARKMEALEDLLLEYALDLESLIQLNGYALKIKVDAEGVNFKSLLKNFLDFSICREGDILSQEPWQHKMKEVVDIFVEMLILQSRERECDTDIILNRLDVHLEDKVYKTLLESLKKESELNSKIHVWNIPENETNYLTDEESFEKTYVVKDNNYELGSFASSYESICRNYPDNNYPNEDMVKEAIIKKFPNHNSSKAYALSKELIILKLYLDLMQIDSKIKIDHSKVTDLELNFLTAQ